MIELIASSLDDALTIEEGGADRIELVSALSEGGYTPSIGLVMEILDRVSIPMAVMLRPNRSAFLYTEMEIETMKRDAIMFDQVGVSHVVMGILDDAGLPDINTMEYILEGTSLKVSFHRAIDDSADVLNSLERINEYDRITHVLTSGGPGKAMDNIHRVRQMIEHTDKRIIVGSGVGFSNVPLIREALDGLDYDLHAGGAVRGGDVKSPVDLDEVESFMELCRF